MSDFKKKVFNKYDGRCAYCGNQITIDNMTVDHKTPKSKGGSLGLFNCLPSCKRCNEFKANETIEFLRKKLSEELPKSLAKNKEFQMLKKYNIVKIEISPVIFLFEKYEESMVEPPRIFKAIP